VNKDQIIARIDAIRCATGDNEAAHFEEDELYKDVLRAIADGAEQPQMLAAAALKANALVYDRWYA